MNRSKQISATFLRDLSNLPTAYFALVMATGIVSTASYNLGFIYIAILLFYFNIAAYLFMSLLYILRIILYPKNFMGDIKDLAKSPGFLTFVAGTCVLGSQFIIIAGNFAIASILFYIGSIAWLILIYTVFTVFTVKKDKPPINKAISGVWLLIIVSTQSVSILASQLTGYIPFANDLISFFALAMFLCGCMFYIIIITLIVYRMSFFEMRAEEFAPAYWINMGAVAISTLAGSTIIQNIQQWSFIIDILPFLKGFTLFFWAIGTWWIPLIVILGIWRHVFKQLPLKYHPQYWGMIFPMGMYTACTIKLSQALELPFLMIIPSFFIYIALVSWSVAAFGMFYFIGKDYLFVKTQHH
ncbi:MAG: tellurite resistance/C4-dicarboxylate transporter family protein [Dysgonamonadaceae bacterium]|nr:tellurite resistance/C4-dicarboxylate transporter family protein [Dysgonamonadaceae bacterium]